MYLITSPDNILLGARGTLKEAKKLVTEHATKTLDEEAEDPRKSMGRDALQTTLSDPRRAICALFDADVSRDPLIVLADPERFAKYLARYRVEHVR
jgi:hypothetical protein